MPNEIKPYTRTEFHKQITANRFRTHGMWGTPTHRTWIHMIQRCTNPKRKCYKDYGAKGVRVCDRWLKFENFLEDMGIRPSGMTLDRWPNKQGNYELENCRWANEFQQARNRTSNKIVTVRGVTGCLQEVCEHFGVSQHVSAINARINKLKWSDERAVLTPIRPLMRLR